MNLVRIGWRPQTYDVGYYVENSIEEPIVNLRTMGISAIRIGQIDRVARAIVRDVDDFREVNAAKFWYLLMPLFIRRLIYWRFWIKRQWNGLKMRIT